jgi:hypothetical protein
MIGKFVLLGDLKAKDETISIGLGEVLWEDSREILVQYATDYNGRMKIKDVRRKSEVLASSDSKTGLLELRHDAYAIWEAYRASIERIRKRPIAVALAERNAKLSELFKVVAQ